jgi:hypothetical protein
MEIWDMAPEEWPESALAPFKDVVPIRPPGPKNVSTNTGPK